MPEITINFTQLSTTAIERSERGIAVLIVKDDTDDTISYVKLKNRAEADEITNYFEPTNIEYIKDVFESGVYELVVIRMSTDATLNSTNVDVSKTTLNNALETMSSLVKSAWITIADGNTDQFKSLASWVKAKYEKGYTYKAVVYQIDNIDHRQIVNFYNTSVVFNDDRGEQTGLSYLPSLIGILASSNISRSVTYYICPNLSGCSVVPEDERNDWLDKGRLFLFIDEDDVKIASGINSMITLDGKTATEDMRYIETVEAMNLINDDIRDVFRSTYIGKYKNNYINQMMFIRSINAYFEDLAGSNILDSDYKNQAEIDIDSLRLALQSVGKDVDSMSEQELRLTTFKRSVFLKANIKILNCMENLEFNISLE